MRKDEEGNECPETLGEYHAICKALSPGSVAVAFLEKKIEEQGADMMVFLPDAQVRGALMPLLLEKAVQVVRSQTDKMRSASIICVDAESLGFEGAIDWAKKNRESLGPWQKIVLAVPKSGGNVGENMKLFHGAMSSFPTNVEMVRNALVFVAEKEDQDAGLPGAVSREEFAETLAQGALPSDDPRKRD